MNGLLMHTLTNDNSLTVDPISKYLGKTSLTENNSSFCHATREICARYKEHIAGVLWLLEHLHRLCIKCIQAIN